MTVTATASWKATNPSDCLPIRKLSQQEKKRQMVHIIYHSLSLSLALSMFCRAEEVSHGYVRLARSHLTKLKFHQPRKTHFFIYFYRTFIPVIVVPILSISSCSSASLPNFSIQANPISYFVFDIQKPNIQAPHQRIQTV